MILLTGIINRQSKFKFYGKNSKLPVVLLKIFLKEDPVNEFVNKKDKEFLFGKTLF